MSEHKNTLKLTLNDIKKIDNGLWTVGQFFDADSFEYIKNSVISSAEDLYMPSPASELRKEMVWMRDGILEELTDCLIESMDMLSSVVGITLKFGQVRVWQDKPGYMIPFHEDDISSYAHFQMYLDSGQENIGTTWYTSNGRHTCPFIPNTGYLTICNERLPHGMLETVDGKNRLSVYATFKQIT